ncbi:MAG: ribosome biogenesis GTP-binding protein YihA/YsxC [Candidatus Paceibacterota bacterium]
MKIKSAVFLRGVKGSNDMLDDGVPQVAFIGRSNAGKSSLINSFTGVKNLARTSSTPGRTQELNIFKINNSVYFIDLPGYGFAKTSFEKWKSINKLLYWYLFDSHHDPIVVVIIDGEIGPTKDDLGMIRSLEEAGREIVVVANKVDKIKNSQYKNQLKKIEDMLYGHRVFPYSSKEKIGIGELSDYLLGRR